MRTRSVAPACTADASRPRRCCMRPRSPTPPAPQLNSASPQPSMVSTSISCTPSRTPWCPACTKGLSGLIDALGITVVNGRGRLTGPTTVEVDGDTITGSSIVLATGSAPKVPQAIATSARVLTSDQALELDVIPDSAIILGGGVIGVEFASLWASFGVKVTIVEALDAVGAERGRSHLHLPRAAVPAPPHHGKDRRAGHRGHLGRRRGAGDPGIRRRARPQTCCWLRSDGRRARRSLGLAEAGVARRRRLRGDRRRVAHQRAERLRHRRHRRRTPVGAPGISARHLRRRAHRRSRGRSSSPTSASRGSPTAIPRSPRSGSPKSRARERYGEGVETVTYDLAGNGRSQILKASGAVKLVVDPSGAVAGVHMIGHGVSELIGEAQLLYNLGVKAPRPPGSCTPTRRRTRRWARR